MQECPLTGPVPENFAKSYFLDGFVFSFIRLDDAIKILEYVLKLREEKLGTAHPDVEDEKKRLTELLKEAGRTRNRTTKSLENLLDGNSRKVKKEGTRRWSGLGFKI